MAVRRGDLIEPRGEDGVGREATPPAAPKPEEKPAEDGTPPDIVSKNDYQLNQALNLLKGLQIIGKR